MRGVLIACLFLTGCATAAPAVISSQPATVTVVKVACIPMKDYSAAEEKALGAAVAELMAGSLLIQAMTDYAALRAEIRACAASS